RAPAAARHDPAPGSGPSCPAVSISTGTGPTSSLPDQVPEPEPFQDAAWNIGAPSTEACRITSQPSPFGTHDPVELHRRADADRLRSAQPAGTSTIRPNTSPPSIFW